MIPGPQRFPDEGALIAEAASTLLLQSLPRLDWEHAGSHAYVNHSTSTGRLYDDGDVEWLQEYEVVLGVQLFLVQYLDFTVQ